MTIPLLPASMAPRNTVALFGSQANNNNHQARVGTTALAVVPGPQLMRDTVQFGHGMNGAKNHHHMNGPATYDAVSYHEMDGMPPSAYQAQELMGRTTASLNKIIKGVGAGLGAFLVTAGFTALLALPAAGFVAIVGCVPLMHWLWPVAAGIATMPLILGGIAGGIKGLLAIFRK